MSSDARKRRDVCENHLNIVTIGFISFVHQIVVDKLATFASVKMTLTASASSFSSMSER